MPLLLLPVLHLSRLVLSRVMTSAASATVRDTMLSNDNCSIIAAQRTQTIARCILDRDNRLARKLVTVSALAEKQLDLSGRHVCLVSPSAFRGEFEVKTIAALHARAPSQPAHENRSKGVF